MSIQVQYRRGTEAQNNAFTGALAEITVDTTNDTIRVHDGATAGGFEVTARQALYADVAERYHADAVYPPGTVMTFGGVNEITQSNLDADPRVIGIISTDPFIIMNSPHRAPDLTNDLHPPVALIGRVPCFVIGPVAKGDLMVSSDVPGYARAWQGINQPPCGSVIGKAISDHAGGVGVIEVLCGRM